MHQTVVDVNFLVNNISRREKNGVNDVILVLTNSGILFITVILPKTLAKHRMYNIYIFINAMLKIFFTKINFCIENFIVL